MGGLLFALVPLVSAQGVGVSEEVKAALEDCRLKETKEESKTCMQSLKEENGLPGFRMGMRFKHMPRPEISDEARTALEACKDKEDKTEKMECVKSVSEGFEIKPPMMMGRFMGRMGRGNGVGECMKMEDRGEASTCFLKIYDRHRSGR